MTDEQKIKAFAQKVTKIMTGKFMDQDDLDGEDGDQWILELVDWLNDAIEELEQETDWNYVTELDAVIGTVIAPDQKIPLPDGARKLAVNERRTLDILQDGTPVSSWDVVRPRDIGTSRYEYPYRERVSYTSKNIVFSRPLNDGEVGGTVTADIVNFIPRVVYTKGTEGAPNNLEALDLVLPKKLLALGVAKDATLPDFVRGDISPSLTQKYTDVLAKAVAENDATSEASIYVSEDMSNISGVY